MTPLQHACYKGNKEALQLLLDRVSSSDFPLSSLHNQLKFQGADVNSGRHQFQYTALHFGALSGNADVCLLLLLAGADQDQVNSVGRTAAQMGVTR
jgi:ankyrin repeat protein